MYNPNTNTTYWNVDKQWNMMQNLSVTDIYDDGHYDAIGTTMYAYLLYGDKRFIDGITSCWIKTPRKYWFGYTYKGQRYPSPEWATNGGSMSCDHCINTFLAFKLAGYTNEQVWEYAKHMRIFLGNRIGFIMKPSLWLWLRLISGKRIGWLYYPYRYMGTIVTNLLLNVLNKITGGFGDETPQSEYKYINNKPKALSFIENMFPPAFELKHKGFQLIVLPESKWKERIKKNNLKLVPSENFLLKLLFGGTVTKEQVDSYQSMYGDRWSDELNPFRTRGTLLEVITNKEHLEANVIDKDLLNYFYNLSNKQ